MSTIRVYLCGAHSTGKTTLLKYMLQENMLGLYVETEVARNVIKTLGWQRSDFDPKTCPENFFTLQLKILQAQCRVDAQNMALCRSYVSDRGIDPIIYCKMYLGNEWFDKILNTTEAMECIERHRSPKTITVVLTPHAECVLDDGMRLPPQMHELHHFTELLIEFLNDRGITFTAVTELDLPTRATLVQSLISHEKRTELDLNSTTTTDQQR